jgi:integrase
MDQPGGRKRVGHEERVAEGVSVRYNRDGQPESIRIAFHFNRIECRERIDGLIPTKVNVRFAIARRGEILSKIARGTFNYADEFPESPLAERFGHVRSGKTVGEVLDEYELAARPTVGASTWAGYKKIIETYLRPWFGSTLLRVLTADAIEEKLVASDVVLKTARNILSVLNMALRRARREIPANPVASVDLELVWPLDRRESNWAPDPFAFEEMEAIFAACVLEEEADYWRVAFGTGMRPSEQIALRWPRVELDRYRLRIEEARVVGLDGDELKGPKTVAGNRWIDTTTGAYEALQRQRGRTGAAGGIVFLDARYDLPWASEGVLRKRFWRLCREAKVRYRNPYQTRHTYASALLAAGRPPLRVAAWMGHEGPEMLYRTYGRWIEQGENPETRRALEAFFRLASEGVAAPSISLPRNAKTAPP